MTPPGAGKVTGVLAGVAAAPVVAAVAAAPALADMSMPPPLELFLPPVPEAEPSCCWGLEDMAPLRVLAIVTLYVMVCHVTLWSAVRIMRLVSTFVTEEIAWLMRRRH